MTKDLPSPGRASLTTAQVGWARVHARGQGSGPHVSAVMGGAGRQRRRPGVRYAALVRPPPDSQHHTHPPSRPPTTHPPAPLPLQVALMDCVRRVVFQEAAPSGRSGTVRLLINRTQEAGVLDK